MTNGDGSGLRGRVAIVGMGVAKSGERWDAGPEVLLREAWREAMADARIGLEDVQAAFVAGVAPWQFNLVTGARGIPVSGIENACATGGDLFRNGAIAIASGAFDLVVVAAAGKQRDAGTTGIVMAGDPSTVGMEAIVHNGSVPRNFALYATRYMHHYGISYEQLRRVLARIAVKNHRHGLLNEKAALRKEVTLEEAMAAPMIAWPLNLYDCCANVDGAACAVLASTAVARRLRDDFVLLRGVGIASGWREGRIRRSYTFTMFPENVLAAQRAYAEAGVRDPRAELSHVELHDAFTVNELVDYEDMGLAPRGGAGPLVEEGYFDLGGPLPVNTDGGLKCTGHPVPATGLKQLYECYRQAQGTAGSRQVPNVRLTMAHSQGGLTGSFTTTVTILSPRD